MRNILRGAIFRTPYGPAAEAYVDRTRGAPVRVPSRLRTKPETVAGASFFGMAELPQYAQLRKCVSLCRLADRRSPCRSTAHHLRARSQEFLELKNDVGQRYG